MFFVLHTGKSPCSRTAVHGEVVGNHGSCQFLVPRSFSTVPSRVIPQPLFRTFKELPIPGLIIVVEVLVERSRYVTKRTSPAPAIRL